MRNLILDFGSARANRAVLALVAVAEIYIIFSLYF